MENILKKEEAYGFLEVRKLDEQYGAASDHEKLLANIDTKLQSLNQLMQEVEDMSASNE